MMIQGTCIAHLDYDVHKYVCSKNIYDKQYFNLMLWSMKI